MRRRTQPFHQSLHRDGKARLADGLDQVIEGFGFECADGELIEGRKKYHLRRRQTPERPPTVVARPGARQVRHRRSRLSTQLASRFDSRGYLTIWRSQGSDCTAFRASSDLERGALAVQGAQSLPRVLDAVALRYDELRVNALPVVRDREFAHGAGATRGDDQAARVGAPRDAMTYRILHSLLQREARYRRGQERVADIEFRP